MKILVIFTGGTIGSKLQDGWISPNGDTKSLLINTYKQNCNDDIQFDTITPYEILSENLSATYLTGLINCLFDNIQSGYDGIIVCHGTDTLQYSAAAAQLCLGNDVCPVVFVSANYPLGNKKSNGHINFKAATKFIKSGQGRGVFVSYSNDLNTANIHIAADLFAHRECDDQIFSLSGPFAVYSDDGIQYLKDNTHQNIKPFGRVKFLSNPGILNITITPFEEYRYDLSEVNAVVLNPYHSGTVNVTNKNFVEFCQRAKQKNIPVILTGVNEESPYETIQNYKNLSIEVLPNTTAITAKILTWIKCSLN